MKNYINSYLIIFLIVCNFSTYAQIDTSDASTKQFKLNFDKPSQYLVNNIRVQGADNLDADIIILLSELSIGETIDIPGQKLTKAIQKLWDQGLFNDVQILVENQINRKIDLVINLQERAKLSKFSFRGLKKGEITDLKEQIGLVRGKVITDHLKIRIKNIITYFLQEKGFFNTNVEIIIKDDDSFANGQSMLIKVDKGQKVKIESINIEGLKSLKQAKAYRLLKETKVRKWYRFWKNSKYIEANYKSDKESIIAHYHNLGYKDAKIISDSVVVIDSQSVALNIKLEEGNRYFIRNITFSGNSKYEDSTLHAILGLNKGTIYDQSLLDKQLFANPSGLDISSLYMNNGYLFFQVTPIEQAIIGDSIDLKINIYEGTQATVNKIIIAGNMKTNEHVVRRELWTIPGQKFSRSDIIQSQRAIANLGYFNPETMGINPIPHPETGTVDVEFKLEEKSTDQVEMSAGWGAGRIIGTLGVTFNNFSTHNFFKKHSWRPVPHGDGQKLSIRASSTGPQFRSTNFSFTEPWFGGKKANSLSLSIFSTLLSNKIPQAMAALYPNLVVNPEDEGKMGITGSNLSFGKKLKWPDNYFMLMSGIEYQRYSLENWANRGFVFGDGISHAIALQEVFSRTSIDQPMYPRTGSKMSITGKATPPYSLFSNRDWSNVSDDIRYKWTEYYKFKYDSEWYTTIWKDLVAKARFSAGYIGSYNNQKGESAFERFQFGGNPMLQGGQMGQFYLGVDQVAMRIVTPEDIAFGSSMQTTYSVFNKYSIDLRYPLTLSPMSTIYVHGFYEAGRAWAALQDFNTNDTRQVVGAGVRIFLPMLGLIGFDIGMKLGPEFAGNRMGTFFTIGMDPY